MRMNRISALLVFLMCFTVFSVLRSPLCDAGNTPEEKPSSDEIQADTAMSEEYDEIRAIKIKKYDVIMGEIADLRNGISAILAREQELSDQKTQAGLDLSSRETAAESAADAVRKATGDFTSKDEALRLFAEAAAKESSGRREKIEKLKGVLIEAQSQQKELQASKTRVETENAARDREAKELSGRVQALETKNPSDPELTRLKAQQSVLEEKTAEGESVRQRFASETLAAAEKERAVEEEISTVEREESLKAKELRAKIEAQDQDKKEEEAKGRQFEELRKVATEKAAKVGEAKAGLLKIEAELGKVSAERLQAEQALVGKIGELNIRVSALVAQNESNEALAPSEAQPGEKDLGKKLKRTQKEVVELRRKTEKTVIANKALKERFAEEALEKHFNLAVVYEMNGLYKDSEKEYLECLKIDPEDADVHYNLAILYDDRLNNNKKAQKHYYKYLAYRPIGESGERARDWIMRSELEKRLGSTVR